MNAWSSVNPYAPAVISEMIRQHEIGMHQSRIFFANVYRRVDRASLRYGPPLEIIREAENRHIQDMAQKFDRQKITHEVSEAVARFEKNNPHHAICSNVTQVFFQDDQLLSYAGDAARRIV